MEAPLEPSCPEYLGEPMHPDPVRALMEPEDVWELLGPPRTGDPVPHPHFRDPTKALFEAAASCGRHGEHICLAQLRWASQVGGDDSPLTTLLRRAKLPAKSPPNQIWAVFAVSEHAPQKPRLGDETAMRELYAELGAGFAVQPIAWEELRADEPDDVPPEAVAATPETADAGQVQLALLDISAEPAVAGKSRGRRQSQAAAKTATPQQGELCFEPIWSQASLFDPPNKGIDSGQRLN